MMIIIIISDCKTSYISALKMKNKTDVLPCSTVSDHNAAYDILKIPTKLSETRFKKNSRNMKNFNASECQADSHNLPFCAIYDFNDPEDQLAVLNKLLFDSINQHDPLKMTKLTRLAVPWIKELDLLYYKTNSKNIDSLITTLQAKKAESIFRTLETS